MFSVIPYFDEAYCLITSAIRSTWGSPPSQEGYWKRYTTALVKTGRQLAGAVAISIAGQVSESLVGLCGLILINLVDVVWFSDDETSGVVESVWKRRRKKNRERAGDLGIFKWIPWTVTARDLQRCLESDMQNDLETTLWGDGILSFTAAMSFAFIWREAW